MCCCYTGCHADFMVGGLCVVAGCHGVLPRTGELFMSTRASSEDNNGVGFLFGVSYGTPTVIIPLAFAPVALGIGILDQCVFSPVWDVLCMPADLAIPTAKMKIVNTAGEPVTNAYACCAGKHEAYKDAPFVGRAIPLRYAGRIRAYGY